MTTTTRDDATEAAAAGLADALVRLEALGATAASGGDPAAVLQHVRAELAAAVAEFRAALVAAQVAGHARREQDDDEET